MCVYCLVKDCCVCYIDWYCLKSILKLVHFISYFQHELTCFHHTWCIYFLTLYTLQHSQCVPTCVWLFHLSSWHLFWRSPFSTPFLFISRNAMHTLRWRHCMLFCLLKTWCNKKNKWKVRDWKVRNNRFCQCIAVWSHFLRFKITHYIEAKFTPS